MLCCDNPESQAPQSPWKYAGCKQSTSSERKHRSKHTIPNQPLNMEPQGLLKPEYPIVQSHLQTSIAVLVRQVSMYYVMSTLHPRFPFAI